MRILVVSVITDLTSGYRSNQRACFAVGYDTSLTHELCIEVEPILTSLTSGVVKTSLTRDWAALTFFGQLVGPHLIRAALDTSTTFL